MPPPPRFGAGAAPRGMAALTTATLATVVGLGHASPPPPPPTSIPPHLAGLSVEWSLVERYMGPNARPVFVNLLRNLGTGVLRVGGGPQDILPFARTTVNDHRVITPADLAAIRATLDAANAGDPPDATPSWGTLIGAGM